ncbi:fumarylacetoacetate hydrolase family protein [Thauera sp. CAU 1555]|uniref:Fumarylacetoacetate hydrolase family protein n=1 Tax=Thauera sedimentorum TaxID=2767595 RepID=A0ABR9BCG1_9RHOO|nr:fumarylacetoacetate hydrolase family protein [Thauera sedimentorum]MBC9073096.1 fumarylacetoacetate hydrolase family protein [Thauera sedimentorum]MBD8504015.1 fumarylacetoacetate hydrolase family protein [Thauera sedimentorum]
MSDKYVIAAPAQPAVPVVGGGLFPVRRIYCVARNYAAHAREMGADPTRESPFFFTKPADAVLSVAEGECGRFPYPPATRSVDHELELVVALGAGGADLSAEQAAGCIWGYAVGLDMTRRDLQAEAKAKGRPWDIGKAFDGAAPISAIVPAAGKVLAAGEISLQVNGETRQHGDLADMIWSVPEVIAFFSRYYRLMPGDLIFTGTPEGVGPVVPGDRLSGRIAGVGTLEIEVVGR